MRLIIALLVFWLTSVFIRSLVEKEEKMKAKKAWKQKKTCLWLKNLPLLEPTDMIPKEQCQSTKVAGNWFNHGGKERQANRAKTFPGIAKAMAEQWG